MSTETVFISAHAAPSTAASGGESNGVSEAQSSSTSLDAAKRDEKRRLRNRRKKLTKKGKRTGDGKRRNSLSAGVRKGTSNRTGVILPEKFEDACNRLYAFGMALTYKNSRSFLLSWEDREDIVGKYLYRCSSRWFRIMGARNPLAYAGSILRSVLSSFVRLRRCKVQVTFKKRTRVKALVKRLKLNNASIIEFGRTETGNQMLIAWISGAQFSKLRGDGRVSSLDILQKDPTGCPVEEAKQIIDPHRRQLRSDIYSDLHTAYEALRESLPKPAAVFYYRVLQGEDWESVAQLIGRKVRRCQQCLRKFLIALCKEFEELREYIRDIWRDIWV